MYRNGANVEDPSTWNEELRRSASSSRWIRALLAWHAIYDRSGLSVVALSGLTGVPPDILLKRMREYGVEHESRVQLYLCSTTRLPVFGLNFNLDEMRWCTPYGADLWCPMALDLAKYHIEHYYNDSMTEDQLRAFDPYNVEDTHGEDCVIDTECWDHIKWIARTNPTNWSFQTFEESW